MNQKTSWVQNPSKTQLVISLTVYIISIILGLAAMTDLFQKPFDLKVNLVLLLLYFFATIAIIKVVRSYSKNLRKG